MSDVETDTTSDRIRPPGEESFTYTVMDPTEARCLGCGDVSAAVGRRGSGPERGDPRPGVTGAPRWAVWVAWAAASTSVPSGLWRMLLAAGVPAGMRRETIRALYDAPGWGSLYLVMLSLVLFGLGSLTLGLVRPWGEVIPTWVPGVGGRHVPAVVAVVPASVGAIGLTALWMPVAVTWWSHGSTTSYTSSAAHTVVGALYAPMALWGPLLAVATVAYARRRARPAEACTEGPPATIVVDTDVIE